jgi:outer membrane receptor for monomeric catechols
MIEDTSRYYDRFQNSDFSWFLEDTYSVLRALSLYAGIRGFYYSTWGPYTYEKEYVYQNFGTGEVADNDSYWSYSLALAYKLQNNSSIKVAWTRSIQLQHLASLSSMPLPNDLWMMASPHLAPQKGHQWSVEYNKETPVFSFSSAAFIRLMQNQLIFNVSLDEAVANFEDHFYRGKGRAYGIEMSVNKKIGNLQGFINYTLSKSERSFLQIFDGDWFNDKFDRTHDLSLMSTFKLSEKWSFSANWTYATGTSMTLPSGRMWMMGTVMNDYDGYNQFRLPDYHRLDLSASLTLKSHLFKSSVLDFSVINLYNRANPYFLFYKVVKSDSNYNIDIGATQISLFPIMPSVSWKFSF